MKVVHTGETLARCVDRTRVVKFQNLLQVLFGSVWCQGIGRLHLVRDNGSTHAPKRLPSWSGALSGLIHNYGDVWCAHPPVPLIRSFSPEGRRSG